MDGPKRETLPPETISRSLVDRRGPVVTSLGSSRRSMFRSQVVTPLLAPLVLLVLLPSTTPLAAQVQLDRFESPHVSWKLVEEDCAAQIVLHQRTGADRFSGDLSETIRIRAGQGTRAYLLHPVPPCRLLPSFAPSLWIKSNRPGLRLMAVVEFPHEPAPDGEGFVKRLIRGPSYDKVGEWQQLDFARLPIDFKLLFQRAVHAVRLNTGRPDFDARDAFVSGIVLDIYGGPGETVVWTDDLAIEGFVPLESATDEVIDAAEVVDRSSRAFDVRNVAWQQEIVLPDGSRPWQSTGRTSIPRRDETHLIVDERPFFLKLVDHQGEPLEQLAAMGFNAVRLTAAPTSAVNQEAARLGLWIIAPPPAGYRALADDREFTRVLAWSVGTQLDARSEQALGELAGSLRTSPATRSRLLHADVRPLAARHSRTLDLVETPLTGELGWPAGIDPYDLLVDFRTRCRGGTLLIGAIPLEASPALVRQVAALGGGNVPDLETTPEAAKRAVFAAIAAGARGIAIRTTGRLDGLDSASRRRAATARWINGWIDRLEPWAAGGQVGSVVGTSRPDWRAASIETPRARLLIALPADGSVVGTPPELALLDSGAFVSARALRVTETGVRPLVQRRTPTGSSILLPERDVVEAVVLTQDPLAVAHLDRAEAPDEAIDQLALQQELLASWTGKQSNVQGELEPYRAGSAEAYAVFRRSIETTANGERMLLGRNLDAAYASLVAARSELDRSRRLLVDSAAGPFATPGASPLCLDIGSLPAHWDLALRLRGTPWLGSTLPGGDFEDLGHMVRSGWRNDRWAATGEEVSIELTTEAAHGGNMALRVRTSGPATPPVPGIDAATVRLTSPEVRVEASHVARIHGWIRAVPGDSQRPLKIWIEDSLGGSRLGRWLTIRPGEWQEFTSYRGAFDTSPLTVTIDIQGYGEVLLDDLTVHTALPTGRR
ncbi:MAG TPA: hypothetical protein DCQ98_07065 [Planctomycetaceae bacterium]|nr:hypothetical protein [Planctomycetaceae bacterium]